MITLHTHTEDNTTYTYRGLHHIHIQRITLHTHAEDYTTYTYSGA
uniref:Uncharacterized protein n=1 Tax=Anguilla anguilla TaxID=7936 RepID=A0A0E9QUS9_ANGAN